MTTLTDWMPMPITDGPLLPKRLGIYWPWYKETPAPTGQYYLTININPPNAGTTSPRGGNYSAGRSVIVNAVPVGGYAFDRWSGDVTGTDRTVTITMDKNKTITANFKTAPAADLTLTLTASPPGGGSAAAVPSLTKYSPGDMVTITAKPASGYTFDHWETDGG